MKDRKIKLSLQREESGFYFHITEDGGKCSECGGKKSGETSFLFFSYWDVARLTINKLEALIDIIHRGEKSDD